MQIFDFGFWKVHARLYPVFFLGRFFVGVSTLSLIIYAQNLLVFVCTFMEYYGHLTYLFTILFFAASFGRGTFLRKFNWDKKTTWKKILPPISTNPYTRANLRMYVWPVSKWPIPNYTWRDKNTNFWMSVCACPFYFFFGGPANGVKRIEPPDASGMQRDPWYSTRNSDFFIKKIFLKKAPWIMTLQIMITVLCFSANKLHE